LEEFEVKQEEIKITKNEALNEKTLIIPVPLGKPLETIAEKLQKELKSSIYEVTDCFEGPFKNGLTIVYKPQKKNIETIIVKIKRADRFISNTSKVAIIIENFNFNADNTTMELLSFPSPLTIIFRPEESKSEWSAKACAEQNKEVLLYLPLESDIRSANPLKIMVHYDDNKILGQIKLVAEKIPIFSGFVILNPSPVIEDSRVIKTIVDDIGKRHGYLAFPDNIKTPALKKALLNSTCPYFIIAKRIISENENVIEDQLRQVILMAQKQNGVVISANGNAQFIKVLKQIYPVFKQNGIQIVPVSNIQSSKK